MRLDLSASIKTFFAIMSLHTIFIMSGYFLLFLISGCQSNIEQNESLAFSISGQTNNIPDSTILYLTDVLSNQKVDSMLVLNNRFSIKGLLDASPTHFYIYSADYSLSKSIWLEPGAITFDATGVDFGHARISGSKTQSEAEELLGAISDTTSDQQAKVLAFRFILRHPANRMSASMLAGYAPAWGRDTVSELYTGLDEKNKGSVYGKRIEQFLTFNKKHDVGDLFSDFKMKSVEGDTIQCSDHLGKVTLLDFWASWCGPCRQHHPELVTIFNKYHSSGFNIVSVSLDFSEDDWKKAISADRLNWIHVSDLKGRNSLAADMYGINTIPDNFLLDAEGRIIAKYLWGEALESMVINELQQ